MNRRRPAAFTLVELLVVVAILVVLAGVLVPLLGPTVDDSQMKATQANLGMLRSAIMGNAGTPGYWGDLRQLPETLADLFVAPSYLPASDQTYERNTRRGWHGPYVQNQSGIYTVNTANGFTTAFGNAGDPAVVDAWGRPVILQIPTAGTPEQQSLYARLVSAGPDGVVTTPGNVLYPALSSRGDDLIVFLRRADAP